MFSADTRRDALCLHFFWLVIRMNGSTGGYGQYFFPTKNSTGSLAAFG